MIALKRYLILFILSGILTDSFSQGVSISDTVVIPQAYKPEFRRLRNHEMIDDEQKAILNSDGKTDNLFTPAGEADIDQILTRFVTRKVDALQYLIESDTVIDQRLKVNYLFGLENLLRHFRSNWNQRTGEKKVFYTSLPSIISAYEQCMAVDRRNASIEPVIADLNYDAGLTVLASTIFANNAGYRPSFDRMILKYCALNPSRNLQTLTAYPDVYFADSLIRVIAKRNPKELYDYAQAGNKLGSLIRSINDDELVKTIVRIARSKDGQQYFCFLDNILHKKINFEQIDAAKDDTVLYFRLLVKTRMDYVARALDKDTAYEYEVLQKRLELKAKDNFVNVINGLHTERNADLRFASIQSLTAEELYYLAVSSDGSIYTSSFVKGVYPLMMKKINYHGDSLLLSLHFDKYRKMIKMCAGFNTLDNFLASFPAGNDPEQEDPAVVLMKAFVKNLERSDGLEDGVDVADSYASVAETLKPIADEMLRNIQLNYDRNKEVGNRKGMAIYNILNKLFLSADTTQKIDLTKELGIPPVYEVPFKSLANDSGRVNVQLFIYGDKDGIGVFPGLISMFSNANWKVDGSNPQWVTISSVKGKPVSLYMNRPLPEETNEDARAQEDLCKWLAANHIIPTVTINRGHSYNAPYTIDQMSPASKIVFMGSCGGYRMIHDILEKAPDAHIIGTKQIADAPVNNPFLKLIMEKLRNGNDIEWIPFWKELGKLVTDKIFEDYVPPHKNLGALFIKAYKKQMGE